MTLPKTLGPEITSNCYITFTEWDPRDDEPQVTVKTLQSAPATVFNGMSLTTIGPKNRLQTSTRCTGTAGLSTVWSSLSTPSDNEPTSLEPSRYEGPFVIQNGTHFKIVDLAPGQVVPMVRIHLLLGF